jgi:Mg-chelatase subunit ChlD
MEGITQKELLVLFDTSGSMEGQEKEVSDGINTTLKAIAQNKKTGETIQVSLNTFDSKIKELQLPFFLEPEVPKYLSSESLEMRGETALYDAVGITVGTLSELSTPSKDVIVVVATDGQDTVSEQYDAESVRALVEEYRTKGVSFIYIASGNDAYRAGEQMGFIASECKRVRVEDNESIGSCFSSQLIRDAISQALGQESIPSGFEEKEGSPSSPKRIKKDEEEEIIGDEVYSQYY